MKAPTAQLAKASAIIAEPTVRYDRTSILLHWTTAALVVLLWGIAQVIDLFPRGTPRVMARSVHIILGAVLAVVLVARVAWRLRSGRRLPMTSPGLMGYAAVIVHYGLYVLVAAAVVFGILNTWVRGDSIFGLYSIPKLAPAITGLRKTVGESHELTANMVLIFAGLHAAAAMFHHFALRDAVLRRMLPARESNESAAVADRRTR
jgi:cytochrome b561